MGGVRKRPHRGQQTPEMPRAFWDMVLNVLGYKEDGEWVALALEMDLRGYGETFEEALAELRDMVCMQIGFARFKAQPEMIWKPADPRFWEVYGSLRAEALKAMARTRATVKKSEQYRAGALPLPEHLWSKKQGAGFALANA